MLTFSQFLLQEVSMARLHSHLQGREVGILTAHRAEPDHHPDWDRVKNLKGKHREDEIRRINHESNRNLESDIKKHGLGYTKVRGRYVENYGEGDKEKPVDEHSFIVMQKKKGHDGGAMQHFLKTHGEKYHQDSVVHKAHNRKRADLLGTKPGGTWPEYGKKKQVGYFNPNRVSLFHSILHGPHGKEHQSQKVINGTRRGLPPSKKVFAFNRKSETRPVED